MPKAAKHQLSAETPAKGGVPSSKVTKRSSSKGSKKSAGANSNSAVANTKPDAANAGKGAKSEKQAESQAPDIANPVLLKKLVDSEESIRSEAITSVSRMVATKRKLDAFDLQKMWKGLWYAMWHSDTPVAQQTLARELADLFAQVDNKNIQAFTEAFWTILIHEWGTLDRYRINKFYLFVRFALNAQFIRLSVGDWNEADIVQFTNMMTSEECGPLSYANSRFPHSLRLHLIDIYVDELSKCFEATKNIPDSSLISGALLPVLGQMEYSEFKHVKQRVSDEVLSDERLEEWHVVESKTNEGDSENDSDNDREDSESSDWEGFD